MGLGGVVAVPARDIVHISPDQPQEIVHRFRGGKQIAAFRHMAIVVDPSRQHLQPRHHHRGRRVGGRDRQGLRQARVMLFQHAACAPVAVLEDPQEADQVAVPDALQLADRVVARLRVGLAGDQINQRVVELGHIGQPGPGRSQIGAELRHEMLHAGLAARDPVGLKQSHLPPAQAKAHADRFVDFFRGGDTILDQPQRLAPDRFKEAVGDMRIDLLADVQRIHSDLAQRFLGRLDHCRVRGRRGHDFGQGQQIDRVERVGDKDGGRVCRPLLQFRRLEARGGGTDRQARSHLLDLRKDAVFQSKILTD